MTFLDESSHYNTYDTVSFVFPYIDLEIKSGQCKRLHSEAYV